MNSSKLALPASVTPLARPAFYWTLADMLVLAKRQLMRIPRSPQELGSATLTPVLMLVLFRYVFGGAIAVPPGTSYVNYPVAGFLVIAGLFGAGPTGIGVVTDLTGSLIDRFRSLPMAKSAVLSGRTLADLIRSTFVLLVVLVVGLVIGFRPEGTIPNWGAALGLILLIDFVLIWFSAFLGLVLSSVEAVGQAWTIVTFPLLFASNAFVPTSTMPAWLGAFAEHQPLAVFITAVRGLLLNQPDATAIWQALAWCVRLLVVMIPLAVWAYGRRNARSE
jgi:ABC-2 type transport system permease protein/oleandomycin transport system permease protein